ncbi:hypothetical protein JHK87_046271 [Glycine soja]|nr:hypothetical protein JHK87_046271 [Glycine soja]
MAGAVSTVSGELKPSILDRVRAAPPPPDSSLLLATRPPRQAVSYLTCSKLFVLLLARFSVTRSGDELSVGLPRFSRSSAETNIIQ